MIPARARGRVDLIINGSFWLGAVGRRAALAAAPEGVAVRARPRLAGRLRDGRAARPRHPVRPPPPAREPALALHPRPRGGGRAISSTRSSARSREETGQELEEPGDSIKVRQRKSIPFREIARTAFKVYPKRAVLGLLAVHRPGVPLQRGHGHPRPHADHLPRRRREQGRPLLRRLRGRQLPRAAAARPPLRHRRPPPDDRRHLPGLRRDAGRRRDRCFNGESFSDWGLTLALAATFFFASAGASSAYLTVSEVFPMEIRALAIAFFYAIGTAIGGITGPLVFQKLGESGDVGQVMIAYLIGAAVMAVGGIVELFLGRARRAAAAREHRQADHRRGGRGGHRRRTAERDDAERSEAEERDRRHRERWERERMGCGGGGPGRAPARAPTRRSCRRPYDPTPTGSTTRSRSSSGRCRSTASSTAHELAGPDRRPLLGAGALPGGAARRVSDGAARRAGRDRYAERSGRRWSAEAVPLTLLACSATGSASGPRARRCAGVRPRVRARGREALPDRRRRGALRARLRPRGPRRPRPPRAALALPLRLVRRAAGRTGADRG